MVKKTLIEIRLCNLMTYIFKGHVTFVKIYMVKFNIKHLLFGNEKLKDDKNNSPIWEFVAILFGT